MKQIKGEITVFLSFILIFILAFVGTVTEVVRVNTSKVFAERALITAMDSIAASYYKPLFTDYHLMLYYMENKNNNNDTDTTNDDKIVEGIKEYMEYTFVPNKDLMLLNSSIKMPNVNLYNIVTKDVTLTNKTFVTDYNGELFINEAIEYMKYRTSIQIIEDILKKLSILKTTKIEVNLVKEKLALTEKLSTLDIHMMELMEFVEGISFDKKGLRLNKNGLIKTQDNFVKKLCTNQITMSNLGINHQLVFDSLKSAYCNPINNLDYINEAVFTIKDYKQKIIDLEKERTLLQEQRENLTTKINNMANKKDEKTKDKNEYGEIVNELLQINEEINRVEKAIKDNSQLKKTSLSKIKQDKMNLFDLVDNVLLEIDLALDIIKKYEEEQVVLSSEIKQYETLVEENRNELNEDFYNEIKEEINSMKLYNNNEETNNINQKKFVNINQFSLNLNQNKNILKDIQIHKDINISEDDVSLDYLLNITNDMKDKLLGYSTNQLSFDYSTLTIESNVENPIDKFKNLLKNGILELVVDDIDSISKKKLLSSNLPSTNQCKNYDKSIEELEPTNLSKDSQEKGYSEITNIFSNFTEVIENINPVNDSTKDIANTLLFYSYLLEHFKNQGSNKESVKETALEYEQEYILLGNERDYENFEGVTTRIITMRTLLNCIYLLSNHEANTKANSIATALVGFTGFTPLIQLTKTVILFVWSYEEALIDTSAILKNKSVPLIKNSSNFILKFEDMLKINKQYIKEKVNNMSDASNVKTSFTYDDYINLLLFLRSQEEISYRSMDIIQSNLNLRNNKEFLMSNCLFGFKVNAEFSVPTKFTNLAFVKMLVNRNQDSYEYNMERAYSY